MIVSQKVRWGDERVGVGVMAYKWSRREPRVPRVMAGAVLRLCCEARPFPAFCSVAIEDTRDDHR